MGAYLIDHPPARDQFAPRTNWSKSRVTGLTVLHTAEGVMDTVGPDTGAEATADFIRRRADPGSYHDLVDSDSWMRLVPLELGAYQDGTGSNGFATSISFACKTVDWARMSPEKRRGFLRQGALAFADQQRERRAKGWPLTELRLITKAQSDAGESGFIYHGHRDPGRRTDPGTTRSAPFPFDEFIAECRAVLAGTTSAAPAQPAPKEAVTMNAVQLTADQPVAVLTVDPVGDSLVMPKGVARAWLQGAAFFPGEGGNGSTDKALLQWLVCLDAKGKNVRAERPTEIGHRWRLLNFELPVGTAQVELRVQNIPAGGVVGFHIDGLGHA